MDSLGVGGAETWIMSLLRYFAKHRIHNGRSFEFDLCLTSGDEAVFDDEARALGATLHYLPTVVAIFGPLQRIFANCCAMAATAQSTTIKNLLGDSILPVDSARCRP